jgi:hypothetical protein
MPYGLLLPTADAAARPSGRQALGSKIVRVQVTKLTRDRARQDPYWIRQPAQIAGWIATQQYWSAVMAHIIKFETYALSRPAQIGSTMRLRSAFVFLRLRHRFSSASLPRLLMTCTRCRIAGVFGIADRLMSKT